VSTKSSPWRAACYGSRETIEGRRGTFLTRKGRIGGRRQFTLTTNSCDRRSRWSHPVTRILGLPANRAKRIKRLEAYRVGVAVGVIF
jgi:hypothetical protein